MTTMAKAKKTSRRPPTALEANGAGRAADRSPAGRHPVADRGRPRADRPGRQLGPGRPLLAHRHPHPPRTSSSEKRAEYGEQIVATLSPQLTAEYGQGFAERNLFRMIQFAEVFPDGEIVATLSRQLGWSHFVELIPLDDPLKRDFYAEMCRVERWSVRTLRDKIGGMLFERTALCKKPDELDRARNSPRSATTTSSRRTWSSATRTSSTSSA